MKRGAQVGSVCFCAWHAQKQSSITLCIICLMRGRRNIPLEVTGVPIIVVARVHNHDTALSIDNLHKIHAHDVPSK